MARRYLVLAAILGFFGAVLLVGAVPPASATIIDFDFVDCATILTPGAVCVPGVSTDSTKDTLLYKDKTFGINFITAKGFSTLGPGATPNLLFLKNEGVGETGLGLTGQPNSEIQPGTFIQLDTSGLPAGTTGDLMISSIQAGEAFEVCRGAVSGLFGATDCVSGTFPPDLQTVTVAFDGGFPFIDITALSGDVLIVNALRVTCPDDLCRPREIPEPSTLALFLTGAAGLVLAWRPKKPV